MSLGTCAEACWYARETDCRCQCDGRNHGIYKPGEQPTRTRRIKGTVYELDSVHPRYSAASQRWSEVIYPNGKFDRTARAETQRIPEACKWPEAQAFAGNGYMVWTAQR